MQNILTSHNVWEKLKKIGEDCHRVSNGECVEIPFEPARDVEIRSVRGLPPKKGLSFKDGQARLLHDLASIELQAMELAFRTLAEFPKAPAQFREELATIALEEAKHLELCLHAMADLGQPWGSYPTHIGLWQSVSSADSLIDRIVIVHRYLEGSGLDASTQLRERLSGVTEAHVHKVVGIIATDEIAHVQFGSRWYREICRQQGLDPEADFKPRLLGLIHRIPRRLERINAKLREKVGFTAGEISALNELREHWRASHPPAERIHAAADSATDPQ